MKAMILCAGYGSRLMPITLSKPKALLHMTRGLCLLELVIERLKSFGFDDIVINVHYRYRDILDFLDSKGNFGIKISISYELDDLLDTGGAIKHASALLRANNNSSFLLWNVDILSNIDLGLMYRSCEEKGVLVSLAVQDIFSERGLFFDNDFMLCGWKKGMDEEIIVRDVERSLYSFSGIHIISLDILDIVEEEGVFSIIDLYLRLSSCGYEIMAYDHSADYCIDIGTFSGIRRASFLKEIYLNFC